MGLSKEEIAGIESKIREKELYSTVEAAKCLHVFTNTVINWISKGFIQCYKTPGGHRKIPAEELIKFVRSHDFYQHLSIRKKRPKILVVEDDEDARNLCISILDSNKYEIKAVENGFFAGIAKEYRPDVMILDVMLPDIDGESVCRFVRSDNDLKQTKIIAVSAVADPEKIDRLFGAGIDDFLGKPYEIADLENKVEQLAHV